MQHNTTQPPSAKRRIAKETLSDGTNSAGDPTEPRGDGEFYDHHQLHEAWDSQEMSLSDSDFPDGWGIIKVRITSSGDCMAITVGHVE